MVEDDKENAFPSSSSSSSLSREGEKGRREGGFRSSSSSYSLLEIARVCACV